MRRLSNRLIGSAAAILAAVAVAGGAAAQEVGKASAVNPNATANLRTITIGTSITHKERVRTTASGSVQLLFVDKTSMTIGPNSDLTIDEYVYDPNAGSGKLAATLSKGALRFVGGQISHTGDAEIKTASATVGIRGGVALIGTNHVFAGYGTSTVSSDGVTVTLEAGEYTSLLGGQPPSPPGPPPPNFVLSQLRLFQSGAGQTGGTAHGAASRANVQRAENRATGSQGGSVAGSLTPAPPTPPTPVVLAATSSLNQTMQTSAQQSAAEQTARESERARPSSLFGFIGGLMTTWPTSGYYAQSATAPLGGEAMIEFDVPHRRVQANFVGSVARGNQTATGLPGSFNYQFGFLDPNEEALGGYADDANFAATAAIRRNGEAVSKIDDAPITNHNAVMVTISREQARQYASEFGFVNATPCDCDYTRWGFWSSGSTQGSYYDLARGFWVAGRPTTASEVPLTGQATYTGHVVASINNHGSEYFSAGNFSNTVNFGSRTGLVNVTGLDGTNYTGQVQFQPDPRFFTGVLSGNVSDRTMGLYGSFFRGVRSPVGEMGGSVAISGHHYLGSGIFAAQMK